MPVVETVEDKPIPGSTVWEPKQGGRLEAVQKLADVLGGIPLVNSVGAFTSVPDEVGEPVGELTLGARGTVVDVGYEVDTDTVYTAVVGQFEDDQRNEIWAVAEQQDGDHAAGGLFGENTRYSSSDLVKTQAQANSAVRSILALSVGSQEYETGIASCRERVCSCV